MSHFPISAGGGLENEKDVLAGSNEFIEESGVASPSLEAQEVNEKALIRKV
jgi:hypothetical protein